MKKITGRQAKSARALLKWNLPDLATKTRVRPERISAFENGLLQLFRWELDELIKIYQDEGIQFRNDFSVILDRSKAKDSQALIDPALVAAADIGINRVTIESEQEYTADSEEQERLEKARREQEESRNAAQMPRDKK